MKDVKMEDVTLKMLVDNAESDIESRFAHGHITNQELGRAIFSIHNYLTERLKDGCDELDKRALKVLDDISAYLD
jgi:hypothetical protein